MTGKHILLLAALLFVHGGCNGSRYLGYSSVSDVSISDICSNIQSSCKRDQILSQDIRLTTCEMFNVFQILYNIPSVSIQQNIDPKSNDNQKNIDNCPAPFKPSLSARLNDYIWPLVLSEHYLTNEEVCTNSLEKLLELENETTMALDEFVNTMNKVICLNNSESQPATPTSPLGLSSCPDCIKAYKNWLCSSQYNLFIPNNITDQSKLDKLTDLQPIRACEDWCAKVESDCPHLRPPLKLSNGGEGIFMCSETHYSHHLEYRTAQHIFCPANRTQCCYSLCNILQESAITPCECRTVEDMCEEYKEVMSMFSSGYGHEGANSYGFWLFSSLFSFAVTYFHIRQ